MGVSGTIANSQCSISLANSSASGSGYAESLNVDVTFASGYAGTKNIYGFAADSAGQTTGWQTLGSWSVPTTSSGGKGSKTPGRGRSK